MSRDTAIHPAGGGGRAAWRSLRSSLAERRGLIAAAIALQMAASAAGLVGPQLLERIINTSGALTDATIDRTGAAVHRSARRPDDVHRGRSGVRGADRRVRARAAA